MRFWNPSYFSARYWASKFWPGAPEEPVGVDATPTDLIPLRAALEEFGSAESVSFEAIDAEAFGEVVARKPDNPAVRELL